MCCVAANTGLLFTKYVSSSWKMYSIDAMFFPLFDSIQRPKLSEWNKDENEEIFKHPPNPHIQLSINMNGFGYAISTHTHTQKQREVGKKANMRKICITCRNR